MGLYQQIKKTWRKSPEAKALNRQRIIEWGKQPATLRIDVPTRLDRARSLGYRAKQGIIIVRQRVTHGGRKRESVSGGRRSKNSSSHKIVSLSLRSIAEMRTARKYPNYEVLNSYYVGRGKYYEWYEVILVDPNSTQIISDPKLNWICDPQHRRRAFRGLTSAGKSIRGLRTKGKGAEKARPSNGANHNRLK